MENRFISAEDNLELINYLGAYVESYKEYPRKVDNFGIDEMIAEFKARLFGEEKVCEFTESYDDFNCNFFYLRKFKKDGRIYSRMENVDYSEEMREFMFKKYGERYLSHLEELAKKERKNAILEAEKELEKEVYDYEIVSARLRNALAMASEKQIYVKLKRANIVKREVDCSQPEA